MGFARWRFLVYRRKPGTANQKPETRNSSFRLRFSVSRAADVSRLVLWLCQPDLLRALFNLDRRRQASVLKLKLAAFLFKLCCLPPQLLILITDCNGLKVLARADDEAARQQSSGKGDDTQPDEDAAADRPRHLRVANLFVGIEPVSHNICLKG